MRHARCADVSPSVAPSPPLQARHTASASASVIGPDLRREPAMAGRTIIALSADASHQWTSSAGISVTIPSPSVAYIAMELAS